MYTYIYIYIYIYTYVYIYIYKNIYIQSKDINTLSSLDQPELSKLMQELGFGRK